MNRVDSDRFKFTADAAPAPHRKGGFRDFPAYAVIAGLNLTALLMLIRRLGGHSFPGLTAERIGIAAVIAAGMALVAREITHRTNGGKESVAWRLCQAFFASSPLLALAVAVASWRFAIAAGATLLAGIVVASAAFFWPVLRPVGSLRATKSPLIPEPDKREEFDIDLRNPEPRPEEAFSLNSDVSDGEWSLEESAYTDCESDKATLRLTRFVTPEGTDRLDGTILAEFPPNRKLVTIHIVFCPPFARTPTFECAAESSGVRVGVSAVYPYGARLELKRTEEIGEPARVPVAFEASLPSPASAAA